MYRYIYTYCIYVRNIRFCFIFYLRNVWAVMAWRPLVQQNEKPLFPYYSVLTHTELESYTTYSFFLFFPSVGWRWHGEDGWGCSYCMYTISYMFVCFCFVLDRFPFLFRLSSVSRCAIIRHTQRPITCTRGRKTSL
jgi:hypothetical protein